MTAQQRAHAAVAKAVRLGEMPRARELSCVDCAKPAVDYDHRDYSKPLEVEPVCRRCHMARGRAKGHPAGGWGFIQLRVTPTEKRQLIAAAKRDGYENLSAWARWQMSRAAAMVSA